MGLVSKVRRNWLIVSGSDNMSPNHSKDRIRDVNDSTRLRERERETKDDPAVYVRLDSLVRKAHLGPHRRHITRSAL